MTPDDAAKLIMSAGLIQPRGPGGAGRDGGSGELDKPHVETQDGLQAA